MENDPDYLKEVDNKLEQALSLLSSNLDDFSSDVDTLVLKNEHLREIIERLEDKIEQSNERISDLEERQRSMDKKLSNLPHRKDLDARFNEVESDVQNKPNNQAMDDTIGRKELAYWLGGFATLIFIALALFRIYLATG